MKREEAMRLVQEGLTQLNEALRQGQSETLVRYLETLARFHAYSFNNAMLILMQMPDATHVAGFRTWQKLGRYVKKGERGIGIMAPMVSRRNSDESRNLDSDTESERVPRGFKVVHVFDVSQTEGEELPRFSAVSGDPGAELAKLERLVASHGIALKYEAIPGGAFGVSRKGEIAVLPDLPPAKTYAVLAHELAHELLHPAEKPRGILSKKVRETEAEAVAFIVCRAVGIESTAHSADYIQLYRGDDAVLAESLDFVQKTAARILRGLADESLREEEERHVA